MMLTAGPRLHQVLGSHRHRAPAPTPSYLPPALCKHGHEQLLLYRQFNSRGHVTHNRLLQPAAANQPAKTQSQSEEPAGSSRTPLFSGASGYGALLTVSVLWGSYNPAVRWLYAQDNAMDPSTLTAVRTVMAAAAMGAAVAWNRLQPAQAEPEIEAAAEDDTIPAPHSVEYAAEQASCSAAGQETSANGEIATSSASPTMPEKPLLARTFTGVIPAGIELGLYNFLGTSLQATGLQLTSATRAGFLVQLTAVLVPMLASAAGIKVSKQLWVAASLALTGTCLIALDHRGSTSSAAALGGSVLNMGDVYLLAACMFFALATVRLGFYSPQHSSVELAGVKKFTLCLASLGWLVAAQGGSGGFAGIGTLIGQQTPLEWTVITYSALGCGALAAFLQTAGQASVPATLAQVIYSLTPLWSAFLAFVLLGDDGMGGLGWAGSAAIIAASLVATTSQLGDKSKLDTVADASASSTAVTSDRSMGAGLQQPTTRQGNPTMVTATAAAAVAAAAVATVVVQYDSLTSIDDIEQTGTQATAATRAASPAPAVNVVLDTQSRSSPPVLAPASPALSEPLVMLERQVPAESDGTPATSDAVEDLAMAPRLAAAEIIEQASALLGAPQPAFAEVLPMQAPQSTEASGSDVTPNQPAADSAGVVSGAASAQPIQVSDHREADVADAVTLQELQAKTQLLELKLAVKTQELQQAISLAEQAMRLAEAADGVESTERA